MQILQKDLGISENVILAPLTTFKIGGRARFFIKAESEEDVLRAFEFAENNEFPLFVLGGGSNCLISDDGFEGLVLQIAVKGISFDGNFVTAGAGEDWDEFCQICVERSLAGLECLSGIPGLVGGTPIQNVGAYGQEVAETIEKVRVFDRKSRQILELSNADCKFSYRSSIFNTTEKNRFIVLSVTFKLQLDGAPKIVYKDLIKYFGQKRPGLRETREAVRKIRATKGMLVRQGGTDAQSAGSFFKNPVIADVDLAKLQELAQAQSLPEVPFFQAGAGKVKVPAAWLIEQSGFTKGFQKGNAGLSTKHTLALTNRGGAKAIEILDLMDEIKSKVLNKFEIELCPEPVLVGFNEKK